MNKILHDWFTEPDNKTWCVVKSLSFVGALCFLVFAGIHVYSNHVFDYLAFGSGFGILMAGCGGSMMMKKDSTL